MFELCGLLIVTRHKIETIKAIS